MEAPGDKINNLCIRLKITIICSGEMVTNNGLSDPLLCVEDRLGTNKSKCDCLFLNIQIIQPNYGSYGMNKWPHWEPYKTVVGNMSVIRNVINIC